MRFNSLGELKDPSNTKVTSLLPHTVLDATEMSNYIFITCRAFSLGIY